MKQSIQYPTKDYERYIEYISGYCEENELSVVLKGSLADGTAKENSDIDLIVLGQITKTLMDMMISGYDTPVMTNYTENPKGIFIIVYRNGICVDIDLRNSITPEELRKGTVLVRKDISFVLSDTVNRKEEIDSTYLPDRPEWYKVLRLIHRALIKYLCGKIHSASQLLGEVLVSLDFIDIRHAETSGDFKRDVIEVFHRIDKKYNVGCEIRDLFKDLFSQL